MATPGGCASRCASTCAPTRASRAQCSTATPSSSPTTPGAASREGRASAARTIGRAAGLGDCINCTMCVQVCPTGIDIRDGLQHQCIACAACAACVDVCDQVMERMGYPKGLVRYTTQNAVDGRPSRVVRPRTLIYAGGLAALLAVFAGSLALRVPAELDVIRDRNALYRETDAVQVVLVQRPDPQRLGKRIARGDLGQPPGGGELRAAVEDPRSDHRQHALALRGMRGVDETVRAQCAQRPRHRRDMPMAERAHNDNNSGNFRLIDDAEEAPPAPTSTPSPPPRGHPDDRTRPRPRRRLAAYRAPPQPARTPSIRTPGTHAGATHRAHARHGAGTPRPLARGRAGRASRRSVGVRQ